MNHDDDTSELGERNELITRAVAELLPFAVELEVDMAYPDVISIELGRRGGPDDPPDSASIDLSQEPTVWTFDIEGGMETIASDLGPDSDPVVVAAWIARQARLAGSPSAVSGNEKAPGR